MSETTKTAELNPEAGIMGAAAVATSESAEILNLLGDQADEGGSCCGGSCCSA